MFFFRAKKTPVKQLKKNKVAAWSCSHTCSLINMQWHTKTSRAAVAGDKDVSGKLLSFFCHPAGRDWGWDNTGPFFSWLSGSRDWSDPLSANNNASVFLLTRVAPMGIPFVFICRLRNTLPIGFWKPNKTLWLDWLADEIFNRLVDG